MFSVGMDAFQMLSKRCYSGLGLKDGTEEDYLLIRHFNINATEIEHGEASNGIQAHVGK